MSYDLESISFTHGMADTEPGLRIHYTMAG